MARGIHHPPQEPDLTLCLSAARAWLRRLVSGSIQGSRWLVLVSQRPLRPIHQNPKGMADVVHGGVGVDRPIRERVRTTLRRNQPRPQARSRGHDVRHDRRPHRRGEGGAPAGRVRAIRPGASAVGRRLKLTVGHVYHC
jgi:hypothetical protein